MSRIKELILSRRSEGGAALICYLTAGYPYPSSFMQYFQACVEGGADIMEIGMPFSDPVADGPVIQATSRQALKMGMTPMRVLEIVKKARLSSKAPIVLMGYYNPIFRIGEERFVRLASEAGVDGLIVADLPLEESLALRDVCRRNSVDLIQLMTPTTPVDRMRTIAQASYGYVYLVAALGTTGSRAELDQDLPELIREAKAAAGELPLAVGFGVSDGNQVGRVVSLKADAVIVGSALLDRISKWDSPDEVRMFVSHLKSGCAMR